MRANGPKGENSVFIHIRYKGRKRWKTKKKWPKIYKGVGARSGNIHVIPSSAKFLLFFITILLLGSAFCSVRFPITIFPNKKTPQFS